MRGKGECGRHCWVIAGAGGRAEGEGSEDLSQIPVLTLLSRLTSVSPTSLFIKQTSEADYFRPLPTLTF